MLYLYYNAKHKCWSKIDSMSYHLKRGAFRREMSEGDRVVSVSHSAVVKILAKATKTRRTKKELVAT